MGSAAGWQLAKEGLSVVLLEMQDTVYEQGSSFGEARIARSNNRGNDIWSYLHNKSVSETIGLIDYLNSTAQGSPYSIEDVYTTSPVTYVGRNSIYEKLFASLIRQKVEYDMAVNTLEGETKYNVTLPDDVLIQREYNKHSGTMNPAALIKLLHKGIIGKGNEVKYNHKVTRISFNGKRQLYNVEVRDLMRNEAKVFSAKKVVSAVGPYTGQLLQEIAPYFQTLITPQRVFLSFLKIKEEVYGNLSLEQKEKLQSFYPVINSAKGTRDGSFFSMIEYFEEDIPIIKIGGHFQRSDISELDQVWSEKLTDHELEWSLNSTADYMRLLKLPIGKEDFEVVNGYSCVYSLTDSEVPLVTPIKAPDTNMPNQNFVVMGGMSGVGAKGAMTYGLFAADALRNTTSESDSLYFVTAEAVGFKRLQQD